MLQIKILTTIGNFVYPLYIGITYSDGSNLNSDVDLFLNQGQSKETVVAETPIYSLARAYTQLLRPKCIKSAQAITWSQEKQKEKSTLE